MEYQVSSGLDGPYVVSISGVFEARARSRVVQ